MKKGYVYIMSNHKRTTLYIDVTSDLPKRILEHREGRGSGFTTRYKLYDLVYYEEQPTMMNAIDREKQLKDWHREWKLDLIRSANPEMKDLFGEI